MLEAADIDLDVVEYLKDPPSKEALRALVAKLGLAARDLVRAGEPEFKASGLDLGAASESELIDLMVAHPKLIQRPIVEVGARARIGRPPEQVLDLLQ